MSLLKLKEVKSVFHHNSPRVAAGLRGTKTTPLFEPNEPDDKWLEFVGKRGWIVFSQDRKFHTDGYENEIYALKQFNVGCFYLWGANATTAEKALAFLKAYDKILEAIKTTPKPFIYDVTKTGKLRKIDIDKRHKKRRSSSQRAA